ncbi:MAG TPA: hypothetical protein VMR21_16890 [Vicinamibacteria bacterium]|nr:hypothetical protein [Vicinamibacteria bacterium]
MRQDFFAALLAALVAGGTAIDAFAAGASAWCGTSRDGARDAVWTHAERAAKAGPAARSLPAARFDVGQVAVLQDEGDLALVRNLMDLQRAGLRFSPSGTGYSVSRVDLPLEAVAGTPLDLTDDDSERVALPFLFPFFGRGYTEAFVNSDGNVTFQEADDASTSRNVGRLVNGPPRAAPLLADLNPETGGSVSFQGLADHVTITWRAVPQFDQTDRNTFQLTLWADGRVDFVYDQEVSASIEEGATGIAPGRAEGGLVGVDFSTAAAVSGGGALAESFRNRDGLDTVAVARKFYATHGDDYQQLVVFTSRRLVPAGTFAFEETVRNADDGIGAGAPDRSAEYGSAGRLESFVLMDFIGKYPDDLSRRFLGEDSALSVLAHEVGHRWLANARFRDGAEVSAELLGRDQVHWSFFADTDGSFLEGNDIEARADGAFRTAGSSLRYSALDQYLMGLRTAAEVPPLFFVRGPSGTDPNPGRTPATGVIFQGTRRDVAVEEILAALGPRNPPGGPWPTAFRQAFVYVAVGGPAEAAAVEKVERIRAAFPAFFAEGTEGRGAVDPTLD